MASSLSNSSTHPTHPECRCEVLTTRPIARHCLRARRKRHDARCRLERAGRGGAFYARLLFFAQSLQQKCCMSRLTYLPSCAISIEQES